MRIDNLNPMMARTMLAALPKSLSGFPRVGDEPPAAAPQPTPTPGTTPPTTVQTLVAIAVAQPMVERRRKLARQAERGIDALDRLHRELVSGVPSPARLNEIAAWAESVSTPDDPVLAQLMSEIDLRVRVELAKYDVQA
ncbi:flagellar assembly protein FliX [Sphingomonas sp. RS6]